MKFLAKAVVCVVTTLAAVSGEPQFKQESESGITHSFLATGGETYIISCENKITWRYPKSTRDGWVLENGNILLAMSKSKEYPSGAVVEVDRDNKVLFEFKGTQSEVDLVEPLVNGNVLTAESGPRPRLMEIDRTGKVVVEIPLQCQTRNHHMQTRMARKLPNGNYLVPHLLDKAIKEYTPAGKVVWEAKTPDDPKECWPFTAIRLANGNTLADLTHGNQTAEFDANGKMVWLATNKDLPGPLFKDPCGCQRLPNGNTVITSYAAGGADEVKVFEITPEKKVVWTFRTGKPGGIHEIHVLETNGRKIEGRPMR